MNCGASTEFVAVLGSMTQNLNHGIFQEIFLERKIFQVSWFILLYFCILSDELLQEFGLKWLTVIGMYSIEIHFVIARIYTGLLGFTVRYLCLCAYS